MRLRAPLAAMCLWFSAPAMKAEGGFRIEAFGRSTSELLTAPSADRLIQQLCERAGRILRKVSIGSCCLFPSRTYRMWHRPHDWRIHETSSFINQCPLVSDLIAIQ